MKGLRRRINGRKINIVTLGCAKNLVDSEQMAGQLKANDYQQVYKMNGGMMEWGNLQLPTVN